MLTFLPPLNSIDEIINLLPKTITIGTTSYGFQFGYDAEKYYSGYQYFESFLEDFVAWSESPVECLKELLKFTIKRARKVY